MKKNLVIFMILALTTLLVFSSVHSDNSDVMTKILVVPDSKPTLTVNIQANKGDWGKYSNGENISFSLEANSTAEVVVIGINTKGQLSLLLPNDYDANNRIYAYQTYHLPRKGYSYKIDTMDRGTEHVVVYATKNHGQIMNNLIGQIRSGSIRNYSQLGSFLNSYTQNTNGDWNSDTVSYYCNYAPSQSSYSKTMILSIGISDYKNNDSLSDLSSPAKDARQFAELMKDKYGVPSSNVTILTNSSASKNGILSAFNTVKNKLDKNTNLLIFFSGHGGQIDDNNGDESDGYDEVICPYDFSKNNKRGSAIVDDEIAGYISGFTSRANKVVFIFDSCYSGSAQKAMMMKNSGWNSPQVKSFSSNGLGAEDGAKALDAKGISNFVFLSSSKGTESSIDAGQELGNSLYTYFLLKGLNGAADSNQNGQITTSEIHNYILNGIKNLSQDYGRYLQTPTIDPNLEIIIAR